MGSWAVQLVRCAAVCSTPSSLAAELTSLHPQAKKHYRAFVVATAGTQNQAFLKELGADECVDYSAVRLQTLHMCSSSAAGLIPRLCRRTGWSGTPASRLTPSSTL